MKCKLSRVTLLVAVLVSVLVGCGPTYYIPLKHSRAVSIKSTRVHATIAQEEVEATVNVQNTPLPNVGLIGALVGAVIDTAITSHRAGEAKKLLEPIRREISDFDFRAAFFESLEQTLPALGALHTAILTSSKLPQTPEVQQVVRTRAPEDAVLFVTTRYEFAVGFRTFSVVTTAELSRKPDQEPLYLATFRYDSAPILGGKEPAEAASSWAAHNAAALREAMREGIDETMKMLVLDLGVATGARIPARAAPAVPGQRQIARRTDGIMYSALRGPRADSGP